MTIVKVKRTKNKVRLQGTLFQNEAPVYAGAFFKAFQPRKAQEGTLPLHKQEQRIWTFLARISLHLTNH